MAASFSSQRLFKLLASIEKSGFVSFDDIVDLGKIARGILKETDSREKRIIAFVLVQLSDIFYQRFEGEPISAEESAHITKNMSAPFRQAIKILLENKSSNDCLLVADNLIQISL